MAAWLERILQRWAGWSARKPAVALAGLLLVTIILGSGIPRIQTDVDLLDILPEGDPNTEAARALQAAFGSAYTQHVTVDLRAHSASCIADSERLLPNRQTPMRCGNSTDEVYVRAQDELMEFFLNQPDSPFEYVVGLNSFFRLINWTAEGGRDAPESAFRIPGTDPASEVRYRLLEETAFQVVPETVTAPMGHDGASYVMLLIPRDGVSSQDVGSAAIQILAHYTAAVDAGETTWTVFGAQNPATFYTELAIADAHSAELVQQDLRVLGPLLLGIIVALLWLGFRTGRGMVVAASTLTMSGVWVFGAMGWLGVPLGTFNLAVAPFLLGVGIDMGIHLLTALQARQHEGSDSVQAARGAAGEAGFAMLIATATTVFGLAVLALGPSPMIGDMGLLSAAAIAAVFIVTMTGAPAMAALVGHGNSLGRAFKPTRLLPRFARHVRRRRAFWAIGLAAVAVVGAFAASSLEPEPFGEYALNYPEGDPYRDRHIENLQVYYNTQPGESLLIGNVLVVEGDMLDPDVHDYIRAIASELEQADHVSTQALTHLPFIVEQYDSVRNGFPGAIGVIAQDALLPPAGQERDTADTREEIEEVLDEMFVGPMAHFAALFVDSDYELSLIGFSTQTGDVEGVRQSWDSVWAAVDRAGAAPPGTEVAFVGNTATNYLFIEEELPFVAWLSLASLVGVFVLVGALTRDVWAACLVAALMVGTAATWLGLLSLLGVGLSIYLIVPIVFITAIGSDYVVHATWAMKHRPPEAVFAVVGKAILFGALTDAAAFAVFAMASDLAIRTTLAAAALAVLVTFAFAIVGVAALAPKSIWQD